jgi:bifunctional non-homologous end joining protein LigD
VVSKVADSRYLSGRSRDRVKVTCRQRETLTSAGFALDGNDWDGIYLGRCKDLVYAGKVDHGFDNASAADLRKRLMPLIRKTQPYSKLIAHNSPQSRRGGISPPAFVIALREVSALGNR